MKTFYLLRHTEYDNPNGILHGRLSFPLTLEGISHAQRVADYFINRKIDVIYTSPVERCRQTAEIVAEHIGSPLVTDKRLLEVLTVLQGASLSQYYSYPKAAYQFVDELGGESQIDVQLRMVDFFNEKNASEQGNIVMCSHGDPLYFLMLYLMGKELPQRSSDVDRALYPKKGSVCPIVISRNSRKLKKMITL